MALSMKGWHVSIGLGANHDPATDLLPKVKVPKPFWAKSLPSHGLLRYSDSIFRAEFSFCRAHYELPQDRKLTRFIGKSSEYRDKLYAFLLPG